ncbi:cyclin-like protein [Blakeslea trispora]|nr:cyclin-like protein [Blakeslea trispora]
MGTTKSRKSRRNNSRPTAFTFLSNIALGNENEKPPDDSIQRLSTYLSPNNAELHYVKDEPAIGVSSLHSSDSSFSADEDQLQTPLPFDAHNRLNTSAVAPVITTHEHHQTRRGKCIAPKQNPSESSSDDVQHHKLTREDSERPIASEKIKKKSYHGERDHGHGSLSILSVFRYYTDKIRNSSSRKKSESFANRGYVQQQLESNDNHKHRRAQSYAHFLVATGSLVDESQVEQDSAPTAYDPFFLDDDTYGKYGLAPSSLGSLNNGARPSDLKREMNEQFRMNHPEIPTEMTLSKIRAIKLHLLEIGKQIDLEVSSVAHAYVFFEKLVIKNVITKKNRKLIAACCLFLATKVNEAKGTWFRPLLDSIDNELGVDEEEIHEHEFAVFADLEFNLYVPRKEFMPHFERIFQSLESKSIQEYLGHSSFYEAKAATCYPIE